MNDDNVKKKKIKLSLLKVYDKPCDNCLLSKDSLVSPKRRDQLLKESDEEDTYFCCHNGENTCCKKYYDAFKRDSRLIRMAVAMDGIEFVPQIESSVRYVSYRESKEY